MKPMYPLFILCLAALPAAAQDDTGEPRTPAPEAAAEAESATPGALELPPSRDPHEGLPQRENQIPIDFGEVDLDGDGKLAIEEAHAAFPPSIVLVDADDDGLVSKAEVRETIPDIAFGDADDGDVGEAEYAVILQEIAAIVEEVEGTDPVNVEDRG